MPLSPSTPASHSLKQSFTRAFFATTISAVSATTTCTSPAKPVIALVSHRPYSSLLTSSVLSPTRRRITDRPRTTTTRSRPTLTDNNTSICKSTQLATKTSSCYFPPTPKMTSLSVFKIKDLTSLDLPSDKIEVEVEGIDKGKLILLKHGGQVHALTANCTHYGAPLVKGVLTPDARLTCPWHGACYNITTGDVEDAPALNALIKYPIFEKDGAVYIKADADSFKTNGRLPIESCGVTQEGNKVVIIGGGSGTMGAVEVLREHGFTGQITVISKEPNLPLDRTKLSKALIPDAEKLLLRPKDWYSSVSVSVVSDIATSVDFGGKAVTTQSGQKYPYTKLILATGGTPRRLPLPGFKELGNIFTLRFTTDVQSILGAVGDQKRNIVIIGSSFIGMEVGNCLATKGNNVTIVGMESAPLERVMGAQIGRIFQSNLQKNGVKFHMSASVEKATPLATDNSKVGAVHLKDGTQIPADLVILGVGVSPATEFLQDNAAIKLEGDGSLKTDENFAVAGLNNDVYAIGDIATFPYHGPGGGQGGKTHVRIEHWDVAQNAGRAAGRAIAHSFSSNSSVPLKPKNFIPIFWSALGVQLRYCGNTMNGFDEVIVRGEPENSKFVAYYTLGETVVAVASMGMDPINTKCAELMRRGRMPEKGEVVDGVDVLKLDLV
ncbi:hypothetical protein AJ79_08857 [Helicocarpus griseus UAMH5409]|uniref:Rieske domain-containing protein n=1 Tax=Helicocarpus griseus UAMH5409 TaxID=1447875 RepID=A0A2B7WNZ8_9EURO|nr:hypothetical protein AJ79_08857 [Helicocarpus griseus UAMH5409]